MALLNPEEIAQMGFKSVGKGVCISNKASFYNCAQISIGDHVRIDDFCVLSAGMGGIEIGNYIHIAVFSSLIGKGKITLSDFANISSRVSIYSSSDDYSGESMTNPMIPENLKKVTHADVFVGKHVIIGCGSVILPGVQLEVGVAIGALTLITETCESFGIYVGSPAKRLKERSKKILLLEENLRNKRKKNI